MQTSASLGIESWPIVLQFYKSAARTINGNVKVATLVKLKYLQVVLI